MNTMKTTLSSEFDLVPEYPETFALWVSTNSGVINTLSQESETSWDFYDINGNNIFTSGSLYSNTQYRDTLTFLLVAILLLCKTLMKMV